MTSSSAWWTIIQTLLLFFGPLLYTKLRDFYKRTKTPHPPQPCPRGVNYLLNILFLSGFVSLLLTLPQFASENIFTLTGSRLQTPTDVLFTRLSKVRDLTPSDEILRSRLASKEARLLYAAYGPAPLVECLWCRLDDAETFLWYAFPSMLLPHLVHGAVIGVVTSSLFSRFGRVWRKPATLAALALCVFELVVIGASGGFYGQAFAISESGVLWRHWRMRVARYCGMAAIDTLLGAAMWANATRRWNIGWETWVAEQRFAEGLAKIERAGGFLQAGRYWKQAVCRDEELRRKFVEWWAKETKVGIELMEDEEVKRVRTDSLPSRINFDSLKRDAEAKSRGLMGLITAARQQQLAPGAKPHQK